MSFQCKYCGSNQAANDEAQRCIRCEIMYNEVKVNVLAAKKVIDEIEKAEEEIPRPLCYCGKC